MPFRIFYSDSDVLLLFSVVFLWIKSSLYIHILYTYINTDGESYYIFTFYISSSVTGGDKCYNLEAQRTVQSEKKNG